LSGQSGKHALRSCMPSCTKKKHSVHAPRSHDACRGQKHATQTCGPHPLPPTCREVAAAPCGSPHNVHRAARGRHAGPCTASVHHGLAPAADAAALPWGRRGPAPAPPPGHCAAINRGVLGAADPQRAPPHHRMNGPPVHRPPAHAEHAKLLLRTTGPGGTATATGTLHRAPLGPAAATPGTRPRTVYITVNKKEAATSSRA
jgi:hypothetical protein